MHATVNAWTLLTGVAAAAGREAKLLKALRRLATPIGIASLDIPYTKKSRLLAGRIADMVPGQFENGAVYTHGHSFFLYGLVETGRGDQAYDELLLSLPGNTFPDIATGAPAPAIQLRRRPFAPQLRPEPLQQLHRFHRLVPEDPRSHDRRPPDLRRPLPEPGRARRLERVPGAPPVPRRRLRYSFPPRQREEQSQFGRAQRKAARSRRTGQFVLPLPARKSSRPIRVEVEL